MAIRTWRFGKTIGLGDLCLALSEADAESYRTDVPGKLDKIKAVCNAYVTPEMIAIGEQRKDQRFNPLPSFWPSGNFISERL